MAGLPFLITTATIAYAALFPANEGRTESPSVLVPSPSSSLSSGDRVFNNSFWVGVGVGMSFSWLASYEIKRRRLWQHARLQFLSWLYDCSSSSSISNDTTSIGGEQTRRVPLTQKFRKPCRISELDGTSIPRKSHSDDDDNDVCGTHLELVSPDWALSSNLYCDVVTLPPGTELVPKKAEGVEFYYVMKGDGIYVDRNGKTYQISAGFGFIVDPECTRGFLVRGATSNLVLLRATDIALSDGHSHVIRLQASYLSSTVAIVRAGVNKVHQLIEMLPSASHQTVAPPPSSGFTNNTHDQ